MERLRKKKIIALFGIFVLVMIIAGIFVISNYDRYKGLISIKNANTKLLGDVSIPTKGTDEVDYEVKYTLDTIENVSKRDVVIKGELNSNYARFKEINKTNVTSEISNNGKSILVTIKDVPLGEEQSIDLKINILNAPNNEEIKPVIEVKEATGEYKRLSTDSILVETNSIEGSVYDENTLKVSNIELSLYKDNTEVKRTYTNTEGNFVFSDLEAGEYVVKIEEDIYELASDSRTSESNTNLILFVKEADKFNIETHKYISNIKLNVNGKEENYSYEDVDKVVRSVKRLKNLSGEIEYKIVLKNNSDKPTRIKEVLDQLQEGLSFDKNKNPGWEKQDNIIKFLPLEDVILEGFEKREVKITLDIVNTNEARTYINKLTTKGEVYERVVFILNGQEIRNIGVTEGNKVSKPVLDEDVIWYTDRNKSNEYNFDNEVTKDLILYGKVNEGPLNTFTVTYMDGDSVFYTEEVKEGKTAKTPENPTKDGYAFVCWKYEDECFNFNNSIVRDIELTSSYELENYSITYNLNGGTLSDNNPNGYTYEDDDIILNNPSKEGYTFTGWTGTGLTDKTLTVTISKNSVGNREYTANYSINRSTLTINPNGGEYNNSSSIVVIEEDYGTVKHIAESSKRGYTFKRYHHSDGGIYSNGTYTFTNDNGSLLAIYDINNYSITYGGLTPDEIATLNNPTTFTVETNTITLNNPSNRVDENGYPSEDFLGWDDGNGNISTNVTIEKGSIDDKTYTAVWKENDDSYSITYNLNGGTLSNTNPNSYTRGTATFTLNNPSKEGYTFTGWTGTNLDNPVVNVTIQKGSVGNRSYTAHYQTIDYSITYGGLTNEELNSLNNPTVFTIESDTITLNNPSTRLDNNGYPLEDFLGWDDGTGNIMPTVIINTGSIKDKTYTAIWKVNEDAYSITYNLNGGYLEQGKTNPNGYNRETDAFTLNNPSKEGYTFTGWTGTDLTGETLVVTVPKGSVGNRSYTANYSINQSTLTIDPNGGKYEDVPSPRIFTEDYGTVKVISLSNKRGYTFVRYNHTGGGIFNDNTYTFNDDDGTLTAVYEINNYSINYSGLTNEELNSLNNPTTFTVESDTFILNNPSSRLDENGYPTEDFVGWDDGTGNTLTTVTIENGSIDNKTYTAIWKENDNEYSITYNLNGGTLSESNPNTYKRQTNTFTLNNPSKEGYTFTGWSGTGIDNLSTEVTITKGSAGNRSYTANYQTIDYSISYSGLTPEEFASLNNPITYNIESTTFTLNNPETRKDSEGHNTEDFLGWDDGRGNVSTNVTIEAGTTGKKTYTAIWKENEDDYSITYNLNGGSLSETNPNTYKRGTATFTLNNPSKTGYTFTGWSGTDITELSTEVTITKGSSGNRSYTANYQTIDYSISYSGLTNDELTSLNNPTTYNIESNTITLNNPSDRVDNNGYPTEDFLGWDDGSGNVSTSVSIETGTTGDKTYTAIWKENEDDYSITYILNGGTLSESNPLTYKRQTNTFTLNNPSKTGYTFTGWSGTDITGLSTEVTITKGSVGNRTYTANYQTIDYSISYSGLTNDELSSLNNPTTYNIESNTITLNNPSVRLDQNNEPIEEFVGWDDGSGNVTPIVTINTGSTGNKTYTAIWRNVIIDYSITYNLDGGTVSNANPTTYNRETETFTLNNPTKEGYTFIGWSGTGIDGMSISVTIPKGSSGNRSYIANYNQGLYTISYAGLTNEELDLLSNPTQYNEETETFTLNNPSREGYVFKGWSGTDIDFKSYTVTFDYQDGRTSTTDTYRETSTPNGWLVNNVHYDDNAVITLSEDIIITRDYLAGAQSITLPTPTRQDFVFVNWNSEPDGTGIIYDNNSINNLDSNTTVYAIWRPDKVTITFNTDGTSVNNKIIEYDTEIGELPNSYKPGYLLEGWYYEPELQNKVLSTDKITSNITLYANWVTDTFPYVYPKHEEDFVCTGSNYIDTGVSLYTDTDDIYLKDYEVGFTIESYTSTGQVQQAVFFNAKWEDSSAKWPGLVFRRESTNNNLEITQTINKGTKKSATFTDWTLPYKVKIYRINHIVYYSINDGERIELQNINNFNQFFDVNAYFCAGDDGSGGAQRYLKGTISNYYIRMGTFSENETHTLQNSDGTLETYLTTSEIEADNNYNSGSNNNSGSSNTGNNNGNNDPGNTNTGGDNNDPNQNTQNNNNNSNITSVIVTDADGVVTIHDVGEEYNLGANTTPDTNKVLNVTVPKGSSGNRLYVANFERNRYTVTYMNGEDKFYEEQIYHEFKAHGTLDIPTRAHSLFTGWYLNDNLFDFENTPITENITLTSGFEEVEAPTISYTPTGWTNSSVEVTLSSSHDDYTYMYKINDGDYQVYTGPFTLTENGTVYAYSVKNTIASLETSQIINNIDKISPTINQSEFGAITSTNAYLDLKMIDEQSGMDRYKVYVDNILVFESLSYSSDLNEEKVDSYLISNLDPLSTYIVKVEVFDVVGNMTSTTLTLETPMGHAVARTLNYEGDEIERYTSLYDAINSDVCVSECHIQMLDSVNERNIIGDNQNIKLDLNGETINGLTSYAFTNNGTLNIVDYNDDSIGQVLSNGTAIINNGTLQIGENETELVVSVTEPVIGGTTYGIDNNGLLKFFDGLLMGNQAVHGLIDETPYLYSANVSDQQGSIQVARLDRVVDPVARIRSVYYTEAQTAIDESKNGYTEEVDYTRPLIEQLKTVGEYGFAYDPISNTAINTNRNFSDDTKAHAYIKIDLSNYMDNQMLTVRAKGDGYMGLSDSADTDGSALQTTYSFSSSRSSDKAIPLEKGKVYYLHFLSYDVDEFIIEKISLGNFDQVEYSNIDDVIIYNDPDRDPFIKNEDGTISNNKEIITSSISHSYFVVDLTNVNEDKYIALTAKMTSSSTKTKAYVYVTNNNKLPSVDSADGRQLYLIRNVSEKTYRIKLIKNQINFVHLCYYKDSNTITEDGFVITQIKPINSDMTGLSDGIIHNNGNYYFEKQDDGSYISNNNGIGDSVANSYMLFDLRNCDIDLSLKANVTVSSEASFDIGYIFVSENTTPPPYSDETGRYYYGSGNETGKEVNITLKANKLNYVHFGYRKDGSVNSNGDYFKINSLLLLRDDQETIGNIIDYMSNVTENQQVSENVPTLNSEPDTVQLLKNVTLTKPLEIVNTRDVILDLNGYTLTTSANNYVINNSGSLKITDSKYNSTAVINSEYKLEQARLYEAAKEQYLADKAEYEEYAGLCDGCEPSQEYIIDQTLSKTFDYTGSEESFKILQTGTYKLEVWGAQGGGTTSSSTVSLEGGYGGYSSGEITLNKDDILYINVGGQGESTPYGTSKTSLGGYNGGGNGANGRSSSGTSSGGGGGATHIATSSGILSSLSTNTNSIILVAGGGGGSHSDTDGNGYNSRGGNGGGYIGTHAFQVDGSCSSSCTKYNYPSGGTQSTGGLGVTSWSSGTTSQTTYAGIFGQGASGSSSYGGGGGGYYGGGSGQYSGGGAGSGYIGNSLLNNKQMVIYSDDENFASDDTDTKTIITSNVSEEAKSNYAKEGNGYAKISLILTDEEYEELINNVSKTYNVKERPIFKDYLTGIDFDDSININEIDADSSVEYSDLIDNELQGTIYSNTNSIIFNDKNAFLNVETGNIVLDNSGSYKFGIVNNGSLTLGKDAYVKSLKTYSNDSGIYNTETGDILDGLGTIESGIINNSLVDRYIKGYTFSKFDNRGLYDLVLDEVNGSIYHDSVGNLTINNSNLGSIETRKTNNGTDNTTLEINDSMVSGHITNHLNMYITSTNINGSISTDKEMVIKDSNIYKEYGNPLINNKGVLTIDGTKIDGVVDTTYDPEYDNISLIIKNYGTLYIFGNTEITRKTIYAIYNASYCTASLQSNCRGNYVYGKTYIGKDDGIVDSQYPKIAGLTSSIYGEYDGSVNFYDGQLIGSIDKPIETPIDDIPENTDIDVTRTNDTEIISLKTENDRINDQDYIAAIGSNEYPSIQSAINAVSISDEPTEIVLLKDLHSASNNIIPVGKNIVINQNGHFVKTYNAGSLFTNNGTLEVTDRSNVNYENISFGTFIENNGIATYSNLKTKTYSTYNKWINPIIINNEGKNITINNAELSGDGKNDDRRYKTDKSNVIRNYGTMTMNDSKVIAISTSTELQYQNNESIQIFNAETGKLYANRTQFNAPAGSIVDNTIYNDGYIELNDSSGNSNYSRYEYDSYASPETSYFINNSTENSHAKISGGTYGGTIRSGTFVLNNGTVELDGVNSNMNFILDNSGTATIENSEFDTAEFIKARKGIINIDDSIVTGTGGYKNETGIIRVMGPTQMNISNSDISTIGNIKSPVIYSTDYVTYYLYEQKLDNISNITLTNTNISANKNAIDFAENTTMTLNINSGKIMSDTTNAINITNLNTTINIGVEGGEVSEQNPEITGSTYGLYNVATESTVNFYDGVISGQTAIYGMITSVEEDYEIITENEGNIEHKYLDKRPLVRNINKVSDNEYYSIQAAIDDASDGDTLELLREYVTISTANTITNEKNIILDLKGFKIQQNNETLIINNGELTISSSSTGGMIEGNTSNALINNGILNITGGKYHSTTTNELITNNADATLNITGGEYYSDMTKIIINYGQMNMSNAKVYNTRRQYEWADYANINNNLIINNENGVINISNSEFEHYGKESVIYNLNRVEIYNSTGELYLIHTNPYDSIINNASTSSYAKINGGSYGINTKGATLVKNSGTVDIINVTSDCEHILYNQYGTATITGGKFGAETGIRTDSDANDGGTINIDGSVISLSSPFGMIISHANLNISNATINGGRYYLFDVYKSNLYFENNTITGVAELFELSNSTLDIISGTYTTTSSGPVINVDSSSTLNLGVKDGIADITTPVITGVSSGISSSGVFNFYDGIISGRTAITGTVIPEEGYDIILEMEGNIEHKYLDMTPLLLNVNQNTEHYTLQDAFENANNGDTLELLRAYTTNPTLGTAVNDKNITLDLKGNTISQLNDIFILNDGELTIKDSLGTARIDNSNGTTFVNNNLLNLQGIKWYRQGADSSIPENSYIVVNNETGITNITDGYYDCGRNSGKNIKNYGVLNMYGNEIHMGRYSSDGVIINEVSGSIISTNGTFSGENVDSLKLFNNKGHLEIYTPVLNINIDDDLYSHHSGSFIYNSADSYTKIVGTISYKDNNCYSDSFNDYYSAFYIVSNEGTLDFVDTSTKSVLNDFVVDISPFISTGGVVNLHNVEFDVRSGIEYGDTGISISGDTVLNIDGNSTLRAANRSIMLLSGTSTTNIISGLIIANNSRYEDPPIIVQEYATLNVGALGSGIPSTTDPIVQGKTYAIRNGSADSNIYFYDGVIIGGTAPVSGAITDYEPGYKEDRNSVTDPDSGITTIQSTLTLIGDDIKTVMVNNINFISLQSAVNYAVNNNISDLQLYNNITLDDDLIKPDGIDVNIHLNGFTINQTVYTIDPGIHLVSDNGNGNNLGASIFNNNVHTENIVIYELDDGSKLSTTNTYKLYDSNNNIVKVNENRIGNYDIGNDREELNTVNGKIYINNITEGTYKLISSDNKEINFEITSDGVSSNIRINNKVIINRVVETIATVIITIQTGTIKLPFILFIILIVIIILSLIAIKKHKRN